MSWSQGPGGPFPVLLHRSAVNGRAQVGRADGGSPAAGADGCRAPVVAAFRRPVALGQQRSAAGGSPGGSARDDGARPGDGLDRGRYQFPQEGRSFGWRRPPVLRSARQAGQLQSRGVAVGGHRGGVAADRLAAVSARGLGRGCWTPGGRQGAEDGDVSNQAADRPGPDRGGAGGRRSGRCRAGRCRLRHHQRLARCADGARPGLCGPGAGHQHGLAAGDDADGAGQAPPRTAAEAAAPGRRRRSGDPGATPGGGSPRPGLGKP